MGTISLPARPVASPFGSKRLLALSADERLVEQIRRGSEAAFEVAFERHGPGILGFCRHMLGSREEAEDALQQVFAAAYRDLQRPGGRAISLKPWLYTIARNRCLSMLRARREYATEDQEIPTVGLAERVERRAELRELLGDIQELPVDQRAALLLSEVGDLSHADVAGVLGCEVAKVKALVFRARSGLIQRRDAREIPCAEIREQLATLRGGSLRRSELRHHVRGCPGCSEFRADVARQRSMLAIALPVALTPELKASVLAGIGGAGGGSAGGAVAAGGGAAAAGGGSTGGAAAVGGGATAAGGGAAAAGGGAAAVGGSAAALGGGAVAAGGGLAGGGAVAAAAGGLGVGASASFGGAALAKVAIVAALAGSGAVAGEAALDHQERKTAGERPAAVEAPATATGVGAASDTLAPSIAPVAPDGVGDFASEGPGEGVQADAPVFPPPLLEAGHAVDPAPLDTAGVIDTAPENGSSSGAAEPQQPPAEAPTTQTDPGSALPEAAPAPVPTGSPGPPAVPSPPEGEAPPPEGDPPAPDDPDPPDPPDPPVIEPPAKNP